MVRPFILLQLSDLHFGEHSRFHGKDLAEVASDCAAAIAEARRDLGWTENVELVLVTGDVTEAARPKEYRAALELFSALRQELSLAARRFVFVPGNHDVSWTECAEVQGKVLDGELDEAQGRALIDECKLARFDAMLAAFYTGTEYNEGTVEKSASPRPPEAGAVTALAAGAYVHDFAELFVSVAALNSCERESCLDEDPAGHGSMVQSQAVLSHWHNEAPADRLRLIAVHHNPIASPLAHLNGWADWLQHRTKRADLSPEAMGIVARFAADVAGFQGRKDLRRIAARAQVSLVLHGHRDVTDRVTAWRWRGVARVKGSAVVLSARSWSLVREKQPGREPVVIQLVRVDPHQREACAVLLRYDPYGSAASTASLGAFVLRSETRKHLWLSLPASLLKVARPNDAGAPTSAATISVAFDAAVRAYRARKAADSGQWKVRGVRPGDGGGHYRSVNAKLDEMYVPLAVTLDGNHTDRQERRAAIGRPEILTTEKLVARERSMAVIGPAGIGKTTWMTWTFRRLLERDDALPFLLELRGLTWGWSEDTTIDAVLEQELAACYIDSSREVLGELLGMVAKLRPVLLVDGWDELGELGADFRQRLDQFRGEHPHVLVVVSSRPYGKERPAEAAGFDTFEIQPLEDEAIKRLVHQFHHRVNAEAHREAAAATAELLARLKAVPAAHALARIPLLLTMVMLLSREQPLPDKRHKLYDACLRKMLYAWPAQRERGGAKLLRTEWRPDDHEQRLLVLSKVAYAMQARDPLARDHNATCARRSKIIAVLPADWSRNNREGFVEWLINSGVALIDRSADTIWFADFGFQEFLAAYYLFCTKVGDELRSTLVEYAAAEHLEEPLRLWAAMVHDQDPHVLGPILVEMRQQSTTRWLAGAILADGSGRDQDVTDWAAELDAGQIRCAARAAYACARAWAGSRHEQRKLLVASSLSANAAMWLDAAVVDEWCTSAKIAWQQPLVLRELVEPWASEPALARSRATLGDGWRVPEHGAGVLLRLWPSRRSRVSVTLQTLISVGGEGEMLQRVAKARLASEVAAVGEGSSMTSISKELVRKFGSDFGRDFGRELVRVFGWDFVRVFGWDFVRVFGWGVARARSRGLGRAAYRFFVRPFGQNLGRGFVQSFAQDFQRYFRRYYGPVCGPDFDRDFVWDSDRDFVRRFVLRHSVDAALLASWNLSDIPIAGKWWPTFVDLELASLAGRASVRSTLASDRLGPIEWSKSELRLFRLACRASLHPGDDASQLDSALAAYDGDPLWPALARHLSRRSTAEDRALLEDLARHPEKREGVLSWCLRYYVRGDLLLQDGTVLTIDELCRELGIEPPPLLEDMPDELPLPDIDLPLDDLGPQAE